MQCPKCGAPSDTARAECGVCGLVFAKWRPPADRPVAPARPRATAHLPPPDALLGLPREGWRSAAVGAALAVALTFFPLLRFLLSPLLTLVHELGHTLTLWLFGYPAIPAFDFLHGGGVTMSENERSPLIVWSLVAGALALAYVRRESKRTLAGIGAGLLLYFLAYDRLGENLLIAIMGHGGELAFAALFLYRGLTGWGCKIPAERPLYAFLGLFIFFADFSLGWKLIRDPYERELYLEGKGGIDHDLVAASSMLSLSLVGFARLFLATSVAIVPLTFLLATQRRRLGVVAEDEEA